MSLRILGGEHRGRPLQAVPGMGTRPLLGKVREALFNVLGQHMEGDVVWDLFAGTGANGIEALSRGARRVVFIEKNNRALAVLRRNLQALGDDSAQRCHVLRGDAWEPGPIHVRGEDHEQPPDVVFFDPPYAMVAEDPAKAAHRAVRLAHRLAAGGVLCFHFRDGQLDEDDFAGPVSVEVRVWGTNAIAFIRSRPAMLGGDAAMA